MIFPLPWSPVSVMAQAYGSMQSLVSLAAAWGKVQQHEEPTFRQMALIAATTMVKFNSMRNRHYYYSSGRYAGHYNKRYYQNKEKKQ